MTCFSKTWILSSELLYAQGFRPFPLLNKQESHSGRRNDGPTVLISINITKISRSYLAQD